MHEQLKVYEEKSEDHEDLDTLAALCRESESSHSGQADGGLLWDTDSDSAGGECIRTGGADDSDSAVGEEYVKGDYQSDPDVGYRNQSDQ